MMRIISNFIIVLLLSSCWLAPNDKPASDKVNENFKGGIDTVLGLPSKPIGNGGLYSNYTLYVVKGVEVLKSMYGWHYNSGNPRWTVDYIKNELATDTFQYAVKVKGTIFRYSWHDINLLNATYGSYIEQAKQNPADLARLIDSKFLDYYDEFNQLLADPSYNQFIPD